MMSSSIKHFKSPLIGVIKRAKIAYDDVMMAGQDQCDKELARNPDYLKLVLIGLEIQRDHGSDAVRNIPHWFYPDNHELRIQATNNLQRFWYGLGGMDGAVKELEDLDLEPGQAAHQRPAVTWLH